MIVTPKIINKQISVNTDIAGEFIIGGMKNIDYV